MVTLRIDLPDGAANQLRREAALRNEPAEAVAARLLLERLQPSPLEGFDITEDQLAVIQDAVDDVRSDRFRDRR